MIRIHRLCKRFGAHDALRNVTTGIEHAHVTAVIGPNGSGKSTLIKCLLGLVRPDDGEIVIANHRITTDPAYRSVIGYMPQTASFPENMTVEKLFTFMQTLRTETRVYDESLVEAFALHTVWEKPLKHLSGGTKQRVNAALAFYFRPKILILDEPTAGLDPVSSSLLKDKILFERAHGATVVLTSHILSDLEELTDDIIFLLDGSVRFTGTPEQLRASTGERTLERSIARVMKGADVWNTPAAF